MHLLPDVSSPIEELNDQDYFPTPVSETTGSAFIAPYWHDANLQCQGDGNVGYIVFGFDEFPLSVLNSPGMTPEVGMIVKYNRVKRFNCPRDQSVSQIIPCRAIGMMCIIKATVLVS